MPLVVTAADITSAIVRIDAAAQGVNDAFNACPQLDAATKAAWTAWYTGWQAWETANKNLGYFTLGLPEIGNQAVAYESDVAGWQADADRLCGSSIPILETQSQAAEQNSALPPSWVEAIKWIAGAVVVALVVPPIAEAIRSMSPLRKPATREGDGASARPR
jgi:hypothetical protein